MTAMSGRPAAGGGRWITVSPERVEGWLARFVETHGTLHAVSVDGRVMLTAADGATAECLLPVAIHAGADPVTSLLAAASADRVVGIVLVRLGGYAVGIAEGQRLTAAAAGSRPVHGRAAAGGWSQHRFARRREEQARTALEAAARAAYRTLTPRRSDIDMVITGGDRRSITAVFREPQLAVLQPLVAERFLDVPDPTRRVLESSIQLVRAVHIRVME